MASFVADIAEGNISGFINSSDYNLAVIHCKVNKTADFFSRVVIEFSLDARWQMMYNGKQFLLNKITVQVGYKGYKATYTASQSMVLHLSYSVAFEINQDLPKELEKAYTGSQDLAINPDKPFVDYSVKISIS